MMLESSSAAWGYYLLGAAGLYAVWWRFTLWINWSLVRRVLRAVMLVILVCPFSVGEGYLDMAPAVLMALMEMVFEGEGAFYRAGSALLIWMGIAATLAVLFDVASRFWKKQPAEKSAAQKQSEARIQALTQEAGPASSASASDQSAPASAI